MNNFDLNQLTVILAFYYFDNNKNNPKHLLNFTNRFNSFFKNDISQQKISYAISVFKNMDLSFIAKPLKNENPLFENVWNTYVADDKIDQLKAIYQHFKLNGESKSTVLEIFDNELPEHINNNLENLTFTYIEDTPKPLYKKNVISKIDNQKRDINVVTNALKLAEYYCEFDCAHPSFLRKKSDFFYTEGHHLIPLEFQNHFEVNLDVEANVVSLCSNCHNQLHYGNDVSTILAMLYTLRVHRLKKCGIEISFDNLLAMYE